MSIHIEVPMDSDSDEDFDPSNEDHDQVAMARHYSAKRARSRSPREIQDLTSDSEDEKMASPKPRRKKPRSQSASPRVLQHGGRRDGAGRKASGQKQVTPAKDWCLTGWFDKMDDEKKQATLEHYYDEGSIHYLCWQIEFCGTTGRKHLQGFVQFKQRVRPTAVRKIFKSGIWAHQQRKGTVEQAIAYTKMAPGDELASGKKKDGTREDDSWVEIGGPPIAQGRSLGLDRVAEMIKDDCTMQEIAHEETVASIKHYNGIEKIRNIIQATDDEPEFDLTDFKEWAEKKIDDFTKTIVIYGEAGIGKTSFAKAHFKQGEYLLVTEIDDIHQFDATKHKAIIVDDGDEWLSKLGRTHAINWIDAKDARTIHARFTNVRIPKRIARIIVTNAEKGNIFSYALMQHRSIYRRMRPLLLEGPVRDDGDNINPFQINNEIQERENRRLERIEIHQDKVRQVRANQPDIDEVFRP